MEYKFARLPDGTLLQFPAETPDSVMDSVVARHMKVPQIKPVPGVAPDTQEGMGWGDVATEAVKNVIPSAKRAAGEIWDAVSDPVGTAKAVGNVALGGIQKLIPGEQEEEKYADAVGQYFADRYGSMEGFKKSLAYDPVGVLSDLSSVFTGGAGLAKGLGKAAGVASARAGANLATVGKGLEKAARYTDPVQVPAFLLGKAVDIGYGKDMSAAQKFYQSALGLNTGFSNNSKARFSPDEVRRITREGLDNKIPVTITGWKKAGDNIWDINNRIDQAIDATDSAGITVDPTAIAVRALESDARKQIASGNTPARDLQAFDTALDEYLRFHGDDTSLRAAQESKKATYRQNEKRYQNNAAPVASGRVEAGMELARQQRQAVADAVDYARDNGLINDTVGMRLHDLNAKEGANIALRDAIERSVLKAGNKGAMDYLTGGIAAATTGDLGTGLVVGAGKQLLTSPGVRSRIAFSLDNLQKYGQLHGAQRPAMATLYTAGSTGSIQDWYDKMYGKRPYGGMLGELAREEGR